MKFHRKIGKVGDLFANTQKFHLLPQTSNTWLTQIQLNTKPNYWSFLTRLKPKVHFSQTTLALYSLFNKMPHCPKLFKFVTSSSNDQQKLIENRILSIPVVDKEGKLTSLLTLKDLVSYIVLTFTDDDFKKHKFSDMLKKKEEFQQKKVSDVKGTAIMQ